MKNIAIIKNSVVENIVSVEEANRAATRTFWEVQGYFCINDAVCSPGDTWNGTNFISPVVIVEPVVETKFSRLQFMNRFTNAELGMIYTTAKTQVAIEVWLDKFKLAEYIDSTDPDTVAGVQMLEQSGLLAVGRANAILGIV